MEANKEGDANQKQPNADNAPSRRILFRIRRILKNASFWTALATVAIAVTSFYQWRAIKGQLREMKNSSTQTDKLIGAANQIEEHQKQLVADNKQGLLDNRNALSASLEENRRELSNALRENRDALKAQTAAANGELEAVQKQTEISERPWLSVEATAVNGLIFVNGEQAALTLKFSIKNVGKSIAKDVQIDVKLFPTAPMPVAADAGKNQRELCEYPKPQQVGRFDVFPTDQAEEREMGISAIPSAIATQPVTNSGDKPRRFAGFYVVGCVTYNSSFGTELHQTRFAYILVGPPIFSPEGGFLMLPNGMPVVGFEVGVDVPQDKLRMIQEFFSRNDAS